MSSSSPPAAHSPRCHPPPTGALPSVAVAVAGDGSTPAEWSVGHPPGGAGLQLAPNLASGGATETPGGLPAGAGEWKLFFQKQVQSAEKTFRPPKLAKNTHLWQVLGILFEQNQLTFYTLATTFPPRRSFFPQRLTEWLGP